MKFTIVDLGIVISTKKWKVNGVNNVLWVWGGGQADNMKQNLTYNDIISLLKVEKEFLKAEFGVLNIGLFGSYAKGIQRADSDIDIIVELKEPRFEWLSGLQIFLEQ